MKEVVIIKQVEYGHRLSIMAMKIYIVHLVEGIFGEVTLMVAIGFH